MRRWRRSRRDASPAGSQIAHAPPVDHGRERQLKRLQREAGFSVADPRLLNLALCHRSFVNEAEGTAHRQVANNEKLEFLGDAVLGIVISSHLYSVAEDRTEGDLARVKSFVVSEDALHRVALKLRLSEYLLLGRGEEMSGGREKKAILADTVEAILGAVYLDSGLPPSWRLVERFLFPEVDRVLSNEHHQDYKTLLQELAQGRYRTHPRYRTLRREGPDHDSTFWIDVTVNGQTFGPGQGKNKKEAEQQAAELAYGRLIGLEDGGGARAQAGGRRASRPGGH